MLQQIYPIAEKTIGKLPLDSLPNTFYFFEISIIIYSKLRQMIKEYFILSSGGQETTSG
jgi:hypothetical protein